MARFLFTVWPFVGHVNPFLSVAKALQERGHDVAFYTGADAKARIEDEGFEVFPLRRIDEPSLWTRIEDAEKNASSAGGSLRLLRTVFGDWLAGTVLDQVADIQEIVHEWRPDALAVDPVMWGPSLILHEIVEPPIATMSTWIGCPLPGPDSPPWGLGLRPPRDVRSRLVARAVAAINEISAIPLRRKISAMRARHGLAPMRCSVNEMAGRLPLYLVPSIPELDYDRRDLPPSVHYVGPCVWNKALREVAPDWLDHTSSDAPWVHVTEGTAHHHEPIVLRAAVEGLADRAMHVILTSGPQRDPESLNLGALAPNLRLEQWVSHDLLLPRCAAMVTTGGAGTVMAGLQAGVPQLIVPTRWDKPDNAQRVVEAGAGLRLEPGRCTAVRLRAAVERLLNETSFKRNADRLAERLAASAGPSRAANLLELLVASRRRQSLQTART
jgi:MGT family glycosyltransferase